MQIGKVLEETEKTWHDLVKKIQKLGDG